MKYKNMHNLIMKRYNPIKNLSEILVYFKIMNSNSY